MQQNQMNQMSDSSSSPQQHVDLESQQQKVLLRARWRRFLLIIKVHRAFMSIPVDKLNKFAPRVSVPSSSSSSSSTAAAVLSTQHYTALSSMVTNEDADEYSYSALPYDQVSIEVHPDAEEQDDYCRRARDNANLQRENIVKIVKDKDMDSLQSFGGVQGMAEALCTDLELGICGDEERLDIRYAGESALLSTTQAIEAPRKGLLGLLKQYSCNNCNILLLSLCAVLSIGFGIKEEGWKTGWNEGAIILVAIFILVAAPSIRDFFRKRSQKLLEMQKPIETGMLTVIRGGCEKEVSISNVMVGDLVYLKSGCPIPGDGLFIVNSGDDQVLVVDHDGLESTADEKTPFLFYGAKVINGNGRMLITSRGMDTVLRELINKVSNTRSLTPLSAQLDKVGATTQIAGISISILILVVLFLRFMLESKHTNKNKHSAGLPDLRNTTATKGIIDIIEKIVKKPSGKISPFTASLTILLVGIQEPIPFLIILATVYWRKKMFSCKVAYAQELLASVTVGSASIICAEKLYQPEIAMFYVGEENIQKDCWVAGIDICVREDLCQCISNPILMQSVPGRSTEDPLLTWAASELGTDMEISKQNSTILEMKALSSDEEGSGVLIRKVDREDGRYEQRLHWKGPATTVLAMCSHYYDCNGVIKDMDENKRGAFKHIVEGMHSEHLKTVAFASKKMDFSILEENDLILVGMIGLKSTCCTKITNAITACQNAGLKIILASEDDVSVLENIAHKCGLFMLPNSVRLKGEVFGNLTEKERMDLVDKIGVMGNSHPSDRLLLVQCLKKKGNVVAVVGTRTTTSAMLKEADVGVAMGIWSSEMARESSDIIVRNGNFSLLASLISHGRCTYNNILKCIQLQLTMIISGTLISFITTVSLVDVPITAIQLILVNFVVNLVGGLALLSEPPTDELMQKPPISQTVPFITKSMWRNIVTQALYQTSILVTFHFKGKNLLGISKQVGKSIVFNSFVLCQVFNLLNSRDPEKKNVFKGLRQNNPCFYVAVFIILILQVSFTEISHIIMDYGRLDKTQWGLCLLMGFISLPIDSSVKLTTSFFKIHPLLPNIIGSTSFTPSVPAESTVSTILELPLMVAGENCESTT
ncbi:calcium-transporting ATPase 12, plasma membrane-type [Ziziphus jujuba]|uniref:Calcium-transporting ATPase 12, plasma membrane-type n=1 Tax=Ziziphus jujuba TaxID=326968 RepID=A0A9B4DTI0_ZIZJJ|nr:calcium-transporting ATPase 12, plasma membrane-type [Ziziphus jujuba]